MPVSSPDPLPLLATLAALSVLSLGAALWWHAVARQPERGVHRWLPRGLLLLGASAATLALAEAAAWRFNVSSDSLDRTLASRRWFERYWQPINALGFRDVEHDHASLQDRLRLFVVGDSFTAGQGIEDPERRYPDLLRRRLSPRWAVVNVSRRGWNTRNELAALKGTVARLDAVPDIVVLGYFLNDILEPGVAAGAELALGETPTNPTDPGQPLPGGEVLPWLATHSHLFDFAYWRLAGRGDQIGLSERHWRALRAAFGPGPVWTRHRDELLRFAARCRNWNAPLIVVLFPYLTDIARSAELTGQVARVLRPTGATVLDLGRRLAGRDPATLVVSSHDQHPNPALHAELAEWLLQSLAAAGAVPEAASEAGPDAAPRDVPGTGPGDVPAAGSGG